MSNLASAFDWLWCGTIEIEYSTVWVVARHFAHVVGEKEQNAYVSFLFKLSFDAQVICFP